MLYYHTTFHLCKHGRVLPILPTYFFFFHSVSRSLGTPLVTCLHDLSIRILHLYHIAPHLYHLLFFCLFAMARSRGPELGRLGYIYSVYDIWSIKIMGMRIRVRHRM